MKKGCVLIQSCDKYSSLWEGFFYYFSKYWDPKIDWDIYLCNEEINVGFSNEKIKQLKTGSGGAYHILNKSLDYLKDYENIFYILEDYWMTNPITKEFFDYLFDIFEKESCDSMRLCTFMPDYYKVKATNIPFLMEYKKDSDWLFSQQAGFWKKEFLKKCIVDPSINEKEYSTSLPFEIACDKNIKEKFDYAKIFHYHYTWYPISGISWRGEISEIGKEMIVRMNIDKKVKEIHDNR